MKLMADSRRFAELVFRRGADRKESLPLQPTEPHPRPVPASEDSANANLDFMRACAVLCVVGFHLVLLFQVAIPGPFVFHSIGHWGVLMFFVHTSLVLNLSLERQRRRAPGARLFWPFLVHRIFRIYPLSIFTVVVVILAALPVGRIEHGHLLPAQLGITGILANLFLVQDLTRSESAIVPLWSLPYEMQMYLLLPALFVLARRVRSVWPLILLWAIAMIPPLRPWYFERHGIPDFIDYVMYFIPGVIAYKLMTSGRGGRLPAFLWPLALLAVTLVFLQAPNPSRGGLCCLLLGLAIPRFKTIAQPVVRRVSGDIARYSYGVYLMHFICMWWAFQGLGGLSSPARWAIFATTLCVVPVVLYHVVEAPMVRLGRRVTARWEASLPSAPPLEPEPADTALADR